MGQASSAQTIPPKVRKFALARRLGAPGMVLELQRTSQIYLIAGFFAFVISSLIIGAYFFLYDTIFSWWPVWQERLVLCMGVIWLFVSIWLMLAPLLYSPVRVFVCPEGLVYVRRRMHAIHWEQIEKVWKKLAVEKGTPVVRSYVLRRNDGATFVFKKELSRSERLGALLDHLVARRYLPQALAAYEAGRALKFGEMTIDIQGISVKRGQKRLYWGEVEDIVIDENLLGISRQGDHDNWATINIAAMPNAEVLKGLLHYIKRDLLRKRMPQVAAYNEGFITFFGRLGISKQGIMIAEEQVVPWSDIGSIGIGENEVIIRKKYPLVEWHTLPIWEIPEPFILKELLEYIMRARR